MKHMKRAYIEITNTCNLNCSFCIKKEHQNTYLSCAQFEHILQEVQPYTRYIYLHILGEPLIHPELDSLLTLTDRYNMHVHITTNGTLLKSNVSLLKKHSIRKVSISVHSFSEQPASYQDQYMQNILEASDQLCESMYISFRLWSLKQGKLTPISKELYSQICRHYGQDTDKPLYRNTLKKGVYLNLDEEFDWPDIHKPCLSSTGTCKGLKDMVAITSRGDVVPCCMDAYAQINLGNIFDTPLSEILNSSRSKAIQKGFLENKLIEPLCQRCGYRHAKFYTPIQNSSKKK